MNCSEAGMSRPGFPLGKQLVMASVLAFGASGVAPGIDASMNLFIGGSHAYFHTCHVEVSEVLVERLESRRRTLSPGSVQNGALKAAEKEQFGP